jgi:phosphoserine aminotransferase
MVPMNLMTPEATADYIITGYWAKKAADEAKKIGKVHVAGTTQAEQFSRIPRRDEIMLSPGAAYVHITSNNTIYGTQWTELPAVGELPLVSDASSDIFSRPIDVARHALIYCGAQKNLGA